MGDWDHIYTLPCVKVIASGRLPHSPGSWDECSAEIDGWDWEVGWRENREGEVFAYIRLIHFIIQQRLT